MPRWLKFALLPAGLAVAAFLLHRIFSRYSLGELAASVASLPTMDLILSAAFAACSYLCLTGFDALALRFVGKPLPYPKVAFASFISLSIGHNLGIAALSSGAVRYRFYSRWGLEPVDVAKLIIFCGLTVALGLLTLGGIAVIVRSGVAAQLSGLPRPSILLIGCACLAVAACYVGAAALSLPPLRYRKWSLEFPSLPIALGQVAIGTLNFSCVAACLYFALRSKTDAGYLGVAVVYVVANGTALVSHVPGGLGVIESVVAYLLPRAEVVGPLLSFRLLYYLIPLLIGGSLFLAFEIRALIAARHVGDRPRTRHRLSSTPQKP